VNDGHNDVYHGEMNVDDDHDHDADRDDDLDDDPGDTNDLCVHHDNHLDHHVLLHP
jgi:hypothetical protein